MANEINSVKIASEVRITTADPSAIGLFGLAMVTLVASSQKLGLTEGLTYALPWAIFLGATAQLIACIYDFKRNNTFGATAFGAYALFWYAIAMSWMTSGGLLFGEVAYDANQLGFAFVGYLVFTIAMTIGALETHKVLFLIFLLIDFLFIGLAGAQFIEPAHEFFHKLAAFSELGISILSFYGCAAAVLNTHFGRVFLPVGKPLGKLKA